MLVDRKLTVVKKTFTSLEQIRELCWAKALDCTYRFILIAFWLKVSPKWKVRLSGFTLAPVCACLVYIWVTEINIYSEYISSFGTPLSIWI